MTALDPLSFRRAMASLPTGVTVVSAPGATGPAGATASAVTSLSLDPPLMLACLDRASRTLAAVQTSERFGISVLRSQHGELARAFSSKAPQDAKWHEVAWSEREGVPILDESLAWVACELRDAHDGGDHVVLTGRVVALGADGGGEPLVFHRGRYRGLGRGERVEPA